MCELPEELTAENGAKALLIGEFYVTVEIPCECHGVGCSLCEGLGYQAYRAPIPWTTIKEIYRRIKDHFVGQQAKWLMRKGGRDA